jgi:hypothetical protein
MGLDQSGIGCANDVESDHDGLEIWKGYVNARRGRLKGVLEEYFILLLQRDSCGRSRYENPTKRQELNLKRLDRKS